MICKNSSGFVSVGYDFQGVVLDFYILISWFLGVVLISMVWSGFLCIGLFYFYGLVWIYITDRLIFVSLPGFLWFCHNFYGAALEFSILITWFLRFFFFLFLGTDLYFFSLVLIFMDSSGFLGSGHDLYVLVLISKDCSRFLHVDLSNFETLSGFLCIGYNSCGVSLNFYILTSRILQVGFVF